MGAAGKHQGRTTGRSVMWFQDDTFLQNDMPERRMTDEQLLTLWRNEFPEAEGAVFTGPQDRALTILRGVRAHYNIGRQGHGARDSQGNIVGGARRLSLPYGPGGVTYWYSDRWLDGVLRARPDLSDPRRALR
jgi:hypothetical protein